MDFWYNIIKIFSSIYRAIFGIFIKAAGGENIHCGPKIIVANHANVSDGLLLSLIFKEKLHFLIQDETFQIPVIGELLSKADQIPVIRGKGCQALETALEKLAAGKSIVIFPEGKLNHGQKFHEARSGAAVLAFRSGIPILPLGFYVPTQHTKMLSKKVSGRKTQGRWQIGGNCYINIGEPIHVSKSNQMEIEYRKLRELNQTMMFKIQKLIDSSKNGINQYTNPIATELERV